MSDEIKLTELEEALSDLSYPTSPETVSAEVGDTTLLLADGETTIDEVLSSSSDDQFEDVEDLSHEIWAHLPREAVGEPYQSEGEG